MTSSNATISGQLRAADLVINNTLASSAIQALVGPRGYTTEEMAVGQAFYEAAVGAVDAQAAAAGTQRQATEHARQAEKEARIAYQGLAQTVRAIFPANSPQRKTLELNGPTPNDTSEFLAVASILFNNALSVAELSSVLAKYGYNSQMLTSERAKIHAFSRAVEAQLLAKSTAQQATSAQAEALFALQRWVAQYLKIAKIALRLEPELLKALIVPTTRGRSITQSSQQVPATKALQR